MPTLANAHLPKPKSWDEFQSIVADALRVRWANSDLQEHGRQGQPQHGVDIFGFDDAGRTVGVQCKHSWLDPVTSRDVEEEISKAESFEPAIEVFYIVTSSERDGKIQRKIWELSAERAKQSKFRVGIFFWDDVAGEITRRKDLVAKHWPELAESNTRSGVRESETIVSTELGFHAKSDTHGEFQAKIINKGKAVVTNWSLQIATPRRIVEAETIACFVREMSDTRTAVFRTTPSFVAAHPLWPGQTYTLSIPYAISDQTTGVRKLPVCATSFVDSAIAAEDEKTVENLSVYFLPAVVERRNAMREVMDRAASLGGEMVEEMRKKR